jgi:hypothetical protein
MPAALEVASRALELLPRHDQHDGQHDEPGEFDAVDHPRDDWVHRSSAAAAHLITGPVWATYR